MHRKMCFIMCIQYWYGEDEEDPCMILMWCGEDKKLAFHPVMALYPEIQRWAQADIGQVVHDRLPTLDDFDSLPYLRAIIKEVSIWAVVPLGLPHRVIQDESMRVTLYRHTVILYLIINYSQYIIIGHLQSLMIVRTSMKADRRSLTQFVLLLLRRFPCGPLGHPVLDYSSESRS
jgi:hypothetical protein